MIPFLYDKNDFNVGDLIYIENVKQGIEKGIGEFKAIVLGNKKREITLKLDYLTPNEREIILQGCLINFYKNEK